MSDQSPKALLRVQEAAAYIGVHPGTIRRWAMDGILPYLTLPGTRQERRFTLADCDALLASMRQPRKVQP
jgi:excisionase family DNA binding protein